jgi:signal transduction histidine kinase
MHFPVPSSGAPDSIADGDDVEPTPPPFGTASQRDAVQRLVSVLADRLGTLTSTISGYADLLVEDQSSREQREIGMNVLEASTRIDDLVADLQHYSRSLEPSPRTVPAAQVARGAVHLLTSGQRSRVRHHVEPPADRTMEADPRLLRQALLNLLQNALDATDPSDDVLLRTTTHTETAETPRLAFEVWNSGEICLDDPTKLFCPFYSTRPRQLGLGLPIATHIANQHGGSVHLSTNDSDEGGTCFTLQI